MSVPRWMAPEIMRTKRPKEAFGPPTGRTKKTDIYAYAMTILEVRETAYFFNEPTDQKGLTRSSEPTMEPSRLL